MRKATLLLGAILLLAGNVQAATLTVTLTGECYRAVDSGILSGQNPYQLGDKLSVTFQYDPDSMVRTDTTYDDGYEAEWETSLETSLDALAWVVTRDEAVFDSGELNDYSNSFATAYSTSSRSDYDPNDWYESFEAGAEEAGSLRDGVMFQFYSLGDEWREPFLPQTELDPGAYDDALLRIITQNWTSPNSTNGSIVTDFSMTSYSVVPEPTAMLLLTAGGMALLRRKR